MVSRLFMWISAAIRVSLIITICMVLSVLRVCVEWLMTAEDRAQIQKLKEKLNG